MANIASGYLSICLDKYYELNKIIVDEIINNLENKNHFIYGSNCDVNFNEEVRGIDLSFTGRCHEIHVGNGLRMKYQMVKIM
tara:strand:+ start:71 stop:316 length:246 start_codon:yes stop_codon:yes gene_type:complete